MSTKKAHPAPHFLDPSSPCARVINDSTGEGVIIVRSTYRENGTITPVDADILARVLNKYLFSSAFARDWGKAVKEHYKE
jgi:hypothetical protein